MTLFSTTAVFLIRAPRKMMLFFTSVGYQSNLRVIKQGGKPLLVMIGLVAVLIVAQNLLSPGNANVNGLLGRMAGKE